MPERGKEGLSTPEKEKENCLFFFFSYKHRMCRPSGIGPICYLRTYAPTRQSRAFPLWGERLRLAWLFELFNGHARGLLGGELREEREGLLYLRESFRRLAWFPHYVLLFPTPMLTAPRPRLFYPFSGPRGPHARRRTRVCVFVHTGAEESFVPPLTYGQLTLLQMLYGSKHRLSQLSLCLVKQHLRINHSLQR